MKKHREGHQKQPIFSGQPQQRELKDKKNGAKTKKTDNRSKKMTRSGGQTTLHGTKGTDS